MTSVEFVEDLRKKLAEARAEVERLRESVRWGDKFLRERNELLEAVDLWKAECEEQATAKAEWMREANRMMKERDEARAKLGVGGVAHDSDTCCCADCCVLRELRTEVERLKAHVARLRLTLGDIEYDKDKVAERQREACANYVRLWRLDPTIGARAWHSEDAVRSVPLVTEAKDGH